MSEGIKAKRIRKGIGYALTFVLLVLYIASASHFELIHSLVHDHDVAVTHSAEQEKDPCHRSIYHTDAEQGCDHDSHLIVSDKCQMCDHVFHGDQHLSVYISFSALEFSQEQFCACKQNLDSYWAIISSSRAPPALT